MNPGYVYVLSNPAMPGLLKIGRSEGDPQLRASQLFTTGVPEPFNIEFVFFTTDCVVLESEIHAAFADVRKRGREFFRSDPKEIIEFILSYELGLTVVTSDEHSSLECLDYQSGSRGLSMEDFLGTISFLPPGSFQEALQDYREYKARLPKVYENVIPLVKADGQN